MKKAVKIFKATYLLVFTGIVFFSLNLFFKFVAVPDLLFPLILLLGALMFFADAIRQRRTKNKNV